ncbi:diguanylate cyclase [Vibrio sp. S9_S30]|uniref:sensor domain-containing diguanylate cyclase n=1 Tax=Vibrio sp. S9_S30 TaxID=2720226 RepID=UPI001680E922|nr:diguanylate cyclase [Vibrio sp. S9_S30]MBD1557478.1 diguanylate cyclase [Vibrio sp. S9_S30]
MKYLSNYHRNNFIILSMIIALIDVLFVFISINSSKQSLSVSIKQQAQQITQSYQTVLEQSKTDMSLLATVIANDPNVKSLIRESFNSPQQESDINAVLNDLLRQKLTNQLKPAWQLIQERYDIKTLQVFLAPDAKAFLRLDQPNLYGDSVDGVRDTVTNVMANGEVQAGYEVGRTIAALRAVAPIFDDYNGKGSANVIAAVDVGIPLSNMLKRIESHIEIGAGVTLRISSIAKSMWLDFQEDYHRMQYIEGCLCIIKHQSAPIFSGLIRQLADASLIKQGIRQDIIEFDGKPLNVIQLPIISYADALKGSNEEAGKVFFWKDASPLYAQYSKAVKQAIMWGALGYILAEIIILWVFMASIKSLEAVIRGHTEDLEESQSNLVQAQRIANTGSWSLNLETDSLYWSEQIYRIFELEEGENEPSYQLFLDVIHPEDRIKVDSAFRESLENKTPFYIGHRLLMQDGRIKYVIQEGKTLFSSNHRPDITVGAVRDITDTYLAQEKEKLAASVFKHAHEGIFISDAKLDIIDVNDACRLFSGVTAYESKKINLLEYQNRFMQPNQFVEMTQALGKEGHWNDEIWIKRSSGEEVALDLNITSIRNEYGQITHYVGIFSDITIKKRQEERLNYIAHFDSLTGLPNRILLIDRLNQAMLQTERSKRHIAILFLDLDGFKKINDGYGHQVGDMMLKHVSEQFQHSIRAGDTVTRFGGDEFVFVIQNVCKPCAYDIPISRILEAVSVPMVYEGHTLHVSASIGITFYPQPDGRPEAETLIKQADTAMYQAKAAGKNGFRIFDDGCVQET